MRSELVVALCAAVCAVAQGVAPVSYRQSLRVRGRARQTRCRPSRQTLTAAARRPRSPSLRRLAPAG